MEDDTKNDDAQNIPDVPKNELEECKEKSDEYLNNWKRAVADLANYKKEEMERLAFLGNYAKEDMLHRVLPILDNFYLAQNHIPEEIKNNNWMQGFLQIKSQILEFLKQAGIDEIESVGKKFDPTYMEIVEEVEGGQSGIVAEELQKGYKMGDKILRPARVKVTK